MRLSRKDYELCLHWQARIEQEAKKPEMQAVFKKLFEDTGRRNLTISNRGTLVPKDTEQGCKRCGMGDEQ